MDNFKKKKIGGFLSLVFSSVLCALAVTVFLVFKYGPSGQYQAEAALLEPSLLPVLSFNDTNSKTGGMTRFIFDSLTFSYFDTSTQKVHNISVTPTQYQKFYNMVRKEKSLPKVPKEVKALFQQGNPAILKLKIKTESQSSWVADTKVFQEVQFATEGNYYRIQLREESSDAGWAYFYHPKIKQQAIKELTTNR